MIKLKSILMEDYTDSSVYEPFVDFTQDLVDLRNLYYELESQSDTMKEFIGGGAGIAAAAYIASRGGGLGYGGSDEPKDWSNPKTTSSKGVRSKEPLTRSQWRTIHSLDSAIHDHVSLVQKSGLPGIMAIMSIDSSDFSASIGTKIKNFFSKLFGMKKEKPFFDISTVSKDIDDLVKKIEELRGQSKQMHEKIKTLKTELESIIKSRTKINNARRKQISMEISRITLDLGQLTNNILSAITRHSNKMTKVAGQGRSEKDYNAIRLMIRGEILKRLQ